MDLRDPIFDTIIGVLATIIVAFVIFLLQRNKKEISYEIISDVPVLTVGTEIKSKVQVFLENRLISDVRLVVLRIKNYNGPSFLVHPHIA